MLLHDDPNLPLSRSVGVVQGSLESKNFAFNLKNDGSEIEGENCD
jgi:hypothetical protein